MFENLKKKRVYISSLATTELFKYKSFFFLIFASFCIEQISHQQHEGYCRLFFASDVYMLGGYDGTEIYAETE